ncbi:MAG: GTPase-associated protein 1-related protein [Actinomycetota bacterium]|nr:GTPase-associated protein 1-related protein [Actinomycetota bacterium]
MTGGGFLSLYYTDCRPGQGLRGGAGFQFQSVSSGVSHDTMTLVQRSALYEAPVAWMREHRAVASYPPSLTHVFDGMYVTARGVYLGAEANGVREGNQFTHAVTTGDPDAYGLIRPAQLWDAPWWSEQPATSTECDPVAAQPEQGPWGIDAIRTWVLRQPDAEDWLIAVSSAFDQAQEPNRRRVLFVGQDAAAILGWIAAGTLLLPQPRALRLGFRVFAINPQYSQHDVLGLHPDWAGSFANLGRDREFVVFNLDSAKHTEVEHTDAAAYWAPRFLRTDPFDVVDAVELAHEFAWQRHLRTDGSTAAADARASSDDRLASGIVVLGESVEGEVPASGLAGWLAGQPSLALEDIVEPVATGVLAASTDATALGELDGAVRLQGLRGELAGRIRQALLSAEIGAVVSGRQPRSATAPIPSHAWTPAERHSATELIEQAANTIPPNRMDLLLRVCASFEIEPRVPHIPDAVRRFVTWWADHPAEPLNPTAWPCQTPLMTLLRDELAQRPDSTALREAIRQHWWPLLLPVVDPGAPLDASVAAAAMEHGQPGVQRDVLKAVREFVQHSDRLDTGDLVWDALFRYVPPTTDQLLELLTGLRRDTASQSFARKALTALAQNSRPQVTYAELTVLARLAELGWNPSDSRLSDLLSQDTALRRWLTSVPARNPDQAGHDAAGLGIVTGMVFRARRSEVLQAVLHDLPLAHTPDVVDSAGERLQSFLLNELPTVWNDRSSGGLRGDTAVAVGLIVIVSESVPDEPLTQFLRRFEKWIGSVDTERLHRVEGLLKSVDPEAFQYCRQAAEDVRPKVRRAKPVRASPSSAKPASTNYDSTKSGSAKENEPAGDTDQQAKKSRWQFHRKRGEK